MPSRAGRFQGLGTILLQPYDEDMDYSFEFPAASAAGANDGAIPFGETLVATPNGSRCVIHKHPELTDYTTEILGTISNTSVTDPVVTVPMSYPYVTLLNGGEPLGETTIVVESTSGMVAGDRVGIVLDTALRAIHWSTISSVTNATTFVIADGLADAAATTKKVFVPRIVKGKYHLTIVCYLTPSGGDREFNFNRVFVRDI